MVIQVLTLMMLMGGTGQVERQHIHVMMGILLEHLAQEEELASQMEHGMDLLSIAIVNTFSICYF